MSVTLLAPPNVEVPWFTSNYNIDNKSILGAPAIEPVGIPDGKVQSGCNDDVSHDV